MCNTQNILRDLVAFPTISERSNLELIGYIEALLIQHEIPFCMVKNEDGNKASLHARVGPAVDGGIVLSGHTDVVPVAGQNWTFEPFSLTEKDGKLYGRGSCDMKGFLASCLNLLPQMIKASLKVPIYLAISYDEEIGCRAAPALIRHLLDHYDEKPGLALIGEPTEMKPVLGQKGIVMIQTTVTGSEGHSSMIRKSVSAVHTAARLVNWIDDRMEDRVRLGITDPRFNPPSTTMHVGKIEGGHAGNVIANHCSFLWDIRSIPGDSAGQIIEDFKAYSEELVAELKTRFEGTEIETSLFHPPVPPLDTPSGSKAALWIEELSGAKAADTVAFATEAGQFSEAGIHAVICGPGSIREAHRADEFLAIQQLEACDAMLARLLDTISN